MNVIRRSTSGLGFILEGTRMILGDPVLRKWAIVPFFIDVVLLIIGLSFGFANIGVWVTSALGLIFSTASGFWYTIFYFPLLIMAWIIFVIVLIYGVYLVASVVASPFNSLLAERALMNLGLVETKPFHFGRWVTVAGKMFFVSLVKSVVFLILGVFIFAMSFVPILNFASSFLALLVLSFDSLDYSFETLEMNFSQRLRTFSQALPEGAGMAGAFAVTLLLPGLTILCMPSAVVGGAIMAKRIKEKGI